MMGDDDKKGLALIIGPGKPGAEGEGEDDEGSDILAAKSLIKAFKAGDAAGVVEGFKLLRDACDSKSGEESDDDY